jgi:transposase-like protein
VRTSQIANHQSRDAIERALLDGRAITRVAAEFRVSASSLYRWQAQHLAPQLREAMRTHERSNASSLIDRIASIADDSLHARRELLANGQLVSATRAAEAELKAIAVLLDRLGIDSSETLEQLRDGEFLARAVGAVSRAHPLFATALADKLTELGAEGIADALRSSIPETRKALT